MANRKRDTVFGRYGKWTVLSDNGRKATCRCDCGTIRDVYPRDLMSGQSASCSKCSHANKARTILRTANTTHGRTNTTEFRVWTDMRRRCHDPRRPDYHRYGGRGITVCERWRESFEAFFADVGERPEGTTLERRDNDGPYSPENCYWATKTQQKRNTRTSRLVIYKGEEMTMAEASVLMGGSRGLILQRVRNGWTVEQAMTIPPDKGRRRKASHSFPH